jgi:hypothetical protein
MRQTTYLDSTILSFQGQLKGCVAQSDGHYCPSQTAGVAQLVEHHLAKVDVASSSLVTRSSIPLCRLAQTLISS